MRRGTPRLEAVGTAKLSRLVVIGVDGMDYALTKRLMGEGRLPRLSAAGAAGGFSPLESTIPAQTAPAWTSLTTGVNPGKHGIYYFYNFSTSPLTIINATNTATPRIWDAVGAAGGRSVVVNVPVTYPASAIQGAMVSGIPPWYFDERSVYPRSLMARLEAGGYEIDSPMGKSLERRPDDLVTRLTKTEERRVGLFLDLLRDEDWSFGMIVLTTLDRMQHPLMGMGEGEDRAVERGYAEVDALVGRIIDGVGTGVSFLVASDHGFNKRPVAFYPNSWLRRRGLLRTKSSFSNRLLASAHDFFDGRFLWAPKGITRRFQGANTTVRTVDAIDLERSRAFVPGTDGVVVVKSEEDAEEVAAGLSALEDGAGRVCRVLPRDKVYRGERLGAAPELLLVPREDINIRTDPFSGDVVTTKGAFPRANHGPTGVFFAVGERIRSAGELRLSVEDVAPTALRLMGIDPPDYMDGRAALEVLDGPGAPPTPLQPAVPSPVAPFEFTEAEEKEILEHLDRLGYR